MLDEEKVEKIVDLLTNRFSELEKAIKELNNSGCEFGRFNRRDMENLRKDLNGIGKKLERTVYLLMGSIITLAINLLTTILKK